MELNSKQQEAVDFVKGNLLIIASAGTGKTTTIVNRYVNMVENHGILPSEIMMTTFTNKAAKDMVEKIKLASDKIPRYIGTLHSIFLRLLRIHAKVLGLQEGFVILSDENDKRKILKEILRNENILDKYENVYYFTNWIGKFKNKGILAADLDDSGSLDDYKDQKVIEELLDDEVLTVSGDLRKKVNLVYKKYQAYLKVNGMLDFDDVLLYTLNLFEDNPDILDKYKNKFKAIMVDEAQDLNVVQIRILELLENDNLCLIGDDCQNIYEWRGASNELVFDFSQNKKAIYLEENYRSKEKIIRAVNDTIKEMRFKIDKQLQCSREVGEDIHVNFYFSLKNELAGIAKRVKELIENGTPEHDIVVLYRTNYIGKFFEKEMLRNRIPCHLSKSRGFFEREEVKDFLSFLRLKINPNSEIDFERVCRLVEGVGEVKVRLIIEYARGEGIDLVEALNFYERFGIESIAGRNLVKLQELIKDLDGNPSFQFFQDFNYEKLIEGIYHFDIRKLKEKRENIKLLKELYAPYGDGMGVMRFLDELIEIDKNEKTDGKVMLSTIHSAKGLEWKHVFLVCCNEGILPYYKEELGAVKRDSELRLFYVAISRAKDNLYVSGSRSHNWNEYDPSHFLELVY
jgi:DNA helicase-2/ATP-dependent DNA helicase PcrA